MQVKVSATVGVLLAAGLALLQPSFAASRFAVLVGVGEYDPNTEVGGVVQSADPNHGINLKSPPNDLALMTEVMAYYGFNDKNSVTISDADATREGITDAVNKNLLTLSAGSLAVFYFSGHGSALKGKDDQGEWNDETIVPYDGRVKGQPARDIVDDEIYRWIDQLSQKSISTVFIFDSCFSGGIARLGGSEVKSLPALTEEKRTSARDGIPSLRTGAVPSQQNAVVILTASDADQPAQGVIFKDQFQGVFTTALHNALLPEERSAPPVTWNEAIARITATLRPAPGERPIQVPHLYGSRDAPIFDSDGRFSNSIDVHRISTIKANLLAGSDLGVTIGSVYKLFGPTQIAWRSSDVFEALATVSGVTAQGAELDVISPYLLNSDALVAVEFEYAVPDHKTKLQLPPRGQMDPFDRAAIMSRLGRVSEVTEVAPELILSAIDGGWQLLTVDSKLVGAPVMTDSSDALSGEIGLRLADYARWKRLSAWRRPGVGSSKLDYRISYQLADEAKILEEDGLQNAKIPAGATVRLLVENRGTQRIKIDALLLRPNFTIDVCPIGVSLPKQELGTESLVLGPQLGPAIWKIVVSDPAQNMSLLFLNSESGSRSGFASLGNEFARLWSGANVSSRGPSPSGNLWRTIDVPFDVVTASNSKSASINKDHRCIGLPQK
jgi:hypothetical protein